MFNQHAKWLKTTKTIRWRKPIATLNDLLTSHGWRQDHNGFSHQDPGFIDHVASKKADVVRIYLPPDANCLISVADHCLRSRNYVNLIIAGKQPEWQWLDMESAVRHCTVGTGIWQWASNDAGDPDVVMACAGEAESIGGREGKFWARDRNDNLLASESADFGTHRDAVTRIGRFLADCRETQPVAVGHRVVHGGPNLRRHCLIDDAVLGQLEAATAFAPLHNPPALSVIRFAQENNPPDRLIIAHLGNGVSVTAVKGG